MSALPHFSRVDKNSKGVESVAVGDAGAARDGDGVDVGRQHAPATAPSRYRKATTTVDARVSSLKILAETIVREIESLEAEDAAGQPEALDLQAEVHRFEAELIRSALVRTEGRQRRAARLLGMKVTTLNAKIRRYKIA